MTVKEDEAMTGTDTGELVERLRVRAANEGDLTTANLMQAAAKRIAELEKALEPFSRAAKYAYDGSNGDERIFGRGCYGGTDHREITVGDLRAARRALEGGKND